jgi:DNA cross-link repair 1A protein
MPKPTRQRSIFDFDITRKQTQLKVKEVTETVETLETIEKLETKETAEKDETVEFMLCPICEFDLTKFNIDARSIHVNRCIDPTIKKESNSSKSSPTKKRRKAEIVKKTEIKSHIVLKEEINDLGDAPIELIKVESISTERKIRKRSPKPTPPIPDHKILRFPGTSSTIAVDAFCYAPQDDISVYLLTHFHSDHYGGLCKSWDKGSLIICTPITSRLLKHKFKFPEENIFVLEKYGERFQLPILKDIRITVFDANHCPGAGVFVLEFNETRYLHCGDFRANEKMIAELNQKFPDGFTRCYLDTTYYDPKYKFPKQMDVIRYAGEWIKDKCSVHKSKQQRVIDFFKSNKEEKINEFLVVIGTYSIGKERLALGIANALNTNIFCTEEKFNVLKLYEWDELTAKLRTDDKDCGVHLLPMSKLKKDQMTAYLKKYSFKYKAVLVIVPTGWTFGYSKDIDRDNTKEGIFETFERGFKNISKHQVHGGLAPVRKVQIPYSEHSSYSELVMFVHGLKCVKEWVATVNMNNIDNNKIKDINL